MYVLPDGLRVAHARAPSAGQPLSIRGPASVARQSRLRSVGSLQCACFCRKVGASLLPECIALATSKPRITITLQPEVYETLRELSAVQGCSMSAVVADLLLSVNPIQQRVLRAARRLVSLDQMARASTVENLAAAEEEFTEMLEPLLASLEAICSGQPPHSNTGVTPTPAPPLSDKPTTRKRTKKQRRGSAE